MKIQLLLPLLFACISNSKGTLTTCPTMTDGAGTGGNATYLGYAYTPAECTTMAENYRDNNDSSVNGMQHGWKYFPMGFECYAYSNLTNTTGIDFMGYSCLLEDTYTGGDPIIVGLKGQVIKFDGEDGKWYSNVATSGLNWNMQFRKYSGCPQDQDMYISGLSISTDSISQSSILIATTMEPIPECRNQDDVVCLGGGMLHISFDGGNTFVSKPGDYHFSQVRLIAHNTYNSCSRKWHDYELTVANNDKQSSLRDKSRRASEKKPEEKLLEQKAKMIDPVECQGWIQERQKLGDLFDQRGLWSTIEIETPLISFHIEFRQSNPQKEDRLCDFQSLDAWISEVSNQLKQQEWSGILGETKERKFIPGTQVEIKKGRSLFLRGKQDADYEVKGPFGTKHAAMNNF